MKKRSFVPILLFSITNPVHAAPICPVDLPAQIDTITNDAKFDRATWGILVQTQTRPILYAQNAKKFLIPASNVKLLTTAAALQALPKDFRVKTSVYKLGGDRYFVYGEGDPSLNDAQLEKLAQQIKQSGVKQIKELILDDKIFGDETVPPNWEVEDIQSDYAPPINGLIVNENAIGLTLKPTQIDQPLEYQWQRPDDSQRYQVENLTKTVNADQPEFLSVSQPTVGVVRLTGQLRIGAEAEPIGFAVQDPLNHFRDRFTTALKKVGISVQNAVKDPKQDLKSPRSSNVAMFAKPIAQVFSPALPEWIQETNRNSNNLYAETLLRSLGTPDKTRKNAIVNVQTHLTALGVSSTTYHLTDGSGLSRTNLVSPEAFVQVLNALEKNATFRSSLPVAGQPGSLKTRFNNTSAQGIVQAKTGYLTGAIALSGYVQPPHYQPLVFSILLNHSTQDLDTQRTAVDSIVILLASLKAC